MATPGGFRRTVARTVIPPEAAWEVRPRWAALRTHPRDPIGLHLSDPRPSMAFRCRTGKGRRSRTTG